MSKFLRKFCRSHNRNLQTLKAGRVVTRSVHFFKWFGGAIIKMIFILRHVEIFIILLSAVGFVWYKIQNNLFFHEYGCHGKMYLSIKVDLCSCCTEPFNFCNSISDFIKNKLKITKLFTDFSQKHNLKSIENRSKINKNVCGR